MYRQYKKYLSTLYNSGQYRKLPLPRQENQNSYLDFSTNDYLGLSKHPEILKASQVAALRYGIGATGSRLLSGNNDLFEILERKIAQDKQTEAALIFNTGFQANLSVLSALLDRKILGAQPLVFFDKLNHASLYQAVFLSNPELVRYNHNDMVQLSALLIKYKNDNRQKFIVTETVFGMDGDILPIQTVIALAHEHKAFLYLDEAHATGIFGINGYGLSTTVNLTNVSYLIMGSFSKALGCAGGYIACNQTLKDYLINKASGFIYSTANSPAIIGAVNKAWDIISSLSTERHHLFSLGKILRKELTNLNFDIGASSSHIVPVILGSENLTISVKEKLLENGIIVSCIRPPTVPLKSSRIRIALTSNHTEHDVEQLVNVLSKL